MRATEAEGAPRWGCLHLGFPREGENAQGPGLGAQDTCPLKAFTYLSDLALKMPQNSPPAGTGKQ